ncbi:MAG: aa3-type cytochrome c oxidase subunit IV [Bauldia sp.]
MADHAANQGAVEMGGVVDIADHIRTYEGFLKLVKYVASAVVIILILMAFFLL